MADRRKIVTHQGMHDLNDLNDQITIEATGEITCGGSDHYYVITTPQYLNTLKFHHMRAADVPPVEANGVTNEALLAIVLDRLEGFQKDEFACVENAKAISHIVHALEWMRMRTAQRKQQGVEGKLAAHTSMGLQTMADGARISVNEEGGELYIRHAGQTYILSLDPLRIGWNSWQAVEGVVKRMNPPITDEELTLLGQIPEAANAHNGFAELRSALGRTRA